MSPRRVVVRSLAKINLDLRVLAKSGGFHELRTVFQTVSVADTIEIEFERSRKTELTIEDALAIPDNLILSAARAMLDELRVSARVKFRLTKRIPMGAGLGGGSSNAAAVLRALPELAGKNVARERAMEIGAALGSDVPFFLMGGTALGLGRGTELYPLNDLRQEPLLIVHTGIHVATGPAYQALGRSEIYDGAPRAIAEFQRYVNGLASCGKASELDGVNDFEEAVFARHPELAATARRLKRAGAKRVRMSGSGSAVFGIFDDRARRDLAAKAIDGARSANIVSRVAYERMWRRSLQSN